MHKFKTNQQKGFTLIELVVVVVIIGILITVAARSLRGSTDGSKMNALVSLADAINNNLSVLSQNCGVSAAVTGNVLPAAGNTLLDVLAGGSTKVAANYQTCYLNSTVLSLAESTQSLGSGAYSAQSFPISLAGGGSSVTPLQVSFAGVPDSIVLLLAQKYNAGLSALAASDTTNSAFQYSTDSSGTRTITFIKQQ